MGEDPRLWTDLLKHIDSIGIIAAFVGLVLAAYQLWVPPSTVARNHDRVTAMARWVSRGSWLLMMQGAVRWVLRLMQNLYGPPHFGPSNIIGNYLTTRAWKMSAWIAALLLFVLFPFLLIIIIAKIEYSRGSSVPLEAILSIGTMSLFLAIPFALTWRATRREDEFADWSGIKNFGLALRKIIVDGTRLSFFAILSTATAAPVMMVSAEDSFLFKSALNFILTVIFLILMLGLLRAIWRYGFVAPLAFLFIVLVIGIYLFQAITLIAFLQFVVMGSLDSTRLPMAILMPAWYFTAQNTLKIMIDNEYHKSRQIMQNFAWIIAANVASILVVASVPLGMMTYEVLRILVVIIFAGLAPYILAIYTVIYSNAIPDWLSIALTRVILSRASETNRLRDFFLYLLWDFMCVIGLCILTGAILTLGFAFAGLMISLASQYAAISKTEAAVNFFLGSLQMPQMILDAFRVFLGGSKTVEREINAGAIVVLMLAILSLTSLIPTVLNAAAILSLVVARCFALVLIPPFKIIHGLLLIDDRMSIEEKRIKMLRSAVLIAMLVVASYLIGYCAFWAII